MKIKEYIPNTLTCCNLLCGCYACILALDGNHAGAMYAVFVAAGFDFVDGLTARMLHVCSPTGKDLDSLADMVSFGVAPGMMLFDFLDRTQQTVPWSSPLCGKAFLTAAFAIPLFSALRLARFNNDARQRESFIGLPVPAHAIFWMSLLHVLTVPAGVPVIGWLHGDWSSLSYPASPVVVLTAMALLAIGSSLLLVANVPMFSLKTKTWRWRDNRLRYAFLTGALGLIVCFDIGGLTASVVLYVFLSIFNRRN